MATQGQSDSVVARGKTPKNLHGSGNFKIFTGKYTTDGTEGAGEIQMVEIPAGHVILGGAVIWDADMGTDITFDVGITGGVVDAFVDGANPSAAAGGHMFAPLATADSAEAHFTADDTIDILLIDGGAIAVTAGVNIEMHVIAVKRSS